MVDIFLLPTDIFYIIADFLLPECRHDRLVFQFSSDFRNFCNTNKLQFLAWKKKTKIIDLKPIYSDKLCKSSKFRERIYEMIENAQEQLMLNFNRSESDDEFRSTVNLSHCSGARQIVATWCILGALPSFPLDYLSLAYCNIQQFPPNNVTVRRFHYCAKIPMFANRPVIDVGTLNITEEAVFQYVELTNYQTLARLQSLTIVDCSFITDVSCFRNIAKLHLRYCFSVTDVSSLSDVNELSLNLCHGLTDVSCLGKVYNLSLSDCSNVRDVSALGNVHILNLDYCPVFDVSTLKNVYELHLSGFYGDTVSSLQNVVILFLNDSPDVTDISMLRNVKVLAVERCPGIIRFHGLQNIQDLTAGQSFGELTKVEMVSGIELFDRLKSFRASGMIVGSEIEEKTDTNSGSQTVSWKHLVHLRSLSLETCQFEIFPIFSFPNLTRLRIIRCKLVNSLELDLPSLRELFIYELFVFKICSLTGSENQFR
jgi:hypothetical protein